MTAFVSRVEWDARPPRTVVADSTHRGVCFHWEGPHMGITSHTQCAAKVRAIQSFHMDSRGWSDIAYNFVPCAHDYVYEGRGWDVRNSANGTTALNSEWLAACYLGGENDPLTEAGKRALRWVFDQAAARGHADRTTHRRIRPEPTACPGDEIDAWVMAGLPTDLEDDMPLDDNDKAWIHNTLVSVLRSEGASGGALNAASALRAEGVSGAKPVADAINAKVDQIAAGNVDYGLLAAKVADVLAARLQS